MAWQSFKRPSRKTFGIRWAVFRPRSEPAPPSPSPLPEPVLVPASAPEFFQKVTRCELWVKRHANWPRSLMGCIKRGADGGEAATARSRSWAKIPNEKPTGKNCRTFLFLFFSLFFWLFLLPRPARHLFSICAVRIWCLPLPLPRPLVLQRAE